MVLVFFIYGLAFFILGFAILLYPKKESAFKLANKMWLIAGFGIVHGINEWIDMFMLIKKPVESPVLKIISLPIMVISFIFLIVFGVKVIGEVKKKYGLLRLLPLFLFAAWLITTMLSSNKFLCGGIYARYLLGAPGIFLTAYALFLLIPEFKDKNLVSVVRNLKIAIGAFFLYGILSGLIVPKAGFFPASIINYAAFLNITGLPVQVFRSVCAVIIAYGMVSVLSIFEWETKIAIKSAKEFTDNILKSMRDGLMIISQDADILFINQTFANIFGKEIIGKKCYEICHKRKGECVLSPLNHPINIGETVMVEDSDMIEGKIFMVSQTGVSNPDGSVSILEIFRDITELKKLERMKDGLVHMIVHDLNNPLMSISGRLQLLKMAAEERSDDELNSDLVCALSSVKELRMMIGDLLDISKMEEEKQVLKVDEFSLSSLLQEVSSEMSVIAKEEKKDLSYILPRDIPDLKADKEIIRRVIANLVNNAIKHTPVKGSITLEAFFREEENSFAIQVKDQGEGIPKEYQDKIFEKFSQLQDAQAKKGHGLGLTFCKMAVEAHGGKIWVESEPGQGSTFIFTIPAKK